MFNLTTAQLQNEIKLMERYVDAETIRRAKANAAGDAEYLLRLKQAINAKYGLGLSL